MTKQSRGFAFIRFKTVAAAQKALKTTHTILGRRCEVRLPKSKVFQIIIRQFLLWFESIFFSKCITSGKIYFHGLINGTIMICFRILCFPAVNFLKY